jgi:superfamily II DNA or RNA helicase
MQGLKPAPAVAPAPQPVEDRGYQLDAVRCWFDADCRGVLEMATGTGKTITAILALQQYLDKHESVAVVVAAPFKHLVDQWSDEMEAFGMRPVLCYESGRSWAVALQRVRSDLNIGIRSAGLSVATHDALRSPLLRKWLQDLPRDTRRLLIADEVHNLGADRSIRSLQHLDFDARLGLSATPRRWNDLETEAIFDYFGETVYEFPLGRAIAEGYLVPYSYYPHFIELAEDELLAYADLNRSLARLGVPDPARPDGDREAMRGRLLHLRSAVLNNATAKIGALRDILAKTPRVRYALVYTTPERIADAVGTVSDGGRRTVHRFTYRESTRERRRLLSAFEQGNLDALVAIRCLDEGVDVPRTELAYILASSSNSREFIQRRGRILRRSPGKAHAAIHDFIALPGGQDDPATWNVERSIVKRELRRFGEFASLATNRYEAEAALLPLQRRYGLFDA